MNKTEIEIKDKILKGLDLTYKKLLKTKKKLNQDLIISENGIIKRISPKDIVIE